ncbi:MAG: 4-hydroxy-tetrahydrodipicolinate synthase, partial [Bacteroidetes bacterium]
MGIFTGTGVAMITPFDAQGNVDVAALRRITTHLIEGKAEYLVVLGTTGESATLTESEQHQVIETVMESAEKRIPVVLGAGGNDTAAVCKKAEALSRRYAPTGLLSVNPYYNKPTQEGIYQHFKAIAASTDLPVILYNVPGRSASNVLAATTLRLAHEVSNIVAVKEASGNLDQITEIIAQKPAGFQVLAGDDSLALPVA